MSAFRKDLDNGYIVVNLSRGPSLKPSVHHTISDAKFEAERLARLEPNHTFQVFRVYAVSEAIRYERKQVDRWFPVFEDRNGYRWPAGMGNKTRKEAMAVLCTPNIRTVDAINIPQTVEGWANHEPEET